MEKVKLFEADNITTLEKDINDWLTLMGLNIEITQRLLGRSTASISFSRITVAIFYKELPAGC